MAYTSKPYLVRPFKFFISLYRTFFCYELRNFAAIASEVISYYIVKQLSYAIDPCMFSNPFQHMDKHAFIPGFHGYCFIFKYRIQHKDAYNAFSPGLLYGSCHSYWQHINHDAGIEAPTAYYKI